MKIAMSLVLVFWTQLGFAESEKKVNFTFKNVRLLEVAEMVSKITGKRFLLESNVSGKVSFISTSPLTSSEIYETFTSVLSLKGFTVCKEGILHKIVKKSKAKRECGLPVSEDLSNVSVGEMTTQIIPIQFNDAREIAKTLRVRISQTYASLVVHEPANAIVVTDTKVNIEKIIKFVDQLEKLTKSTRKTKPKYKKTCGCDKKKKRKSSCGSNQSTARAQQFYVPPPLNPAEPPWMKNPAKSESSSSSKKTNSAKQ